MWKTNKWVPEWVIRHAIAHLHPGPQPPCRCACCRSRKSESQIGELNRRVRSHRGQQTGGKPVLSATGSVLTAHHCCPGSPFTAPVASSWKPEVLYVILLLDFCRFFKSQRHFFSEHLQCVLHKYLLLQLYLWAWVTSSPTLFTLVTPFQPHWSPRFSGMYPPCFCLRAFAIAFFQPKTFCPLLS